MATHDHQLTAAVALCSMVDGLALTLEGDLPNNARLMGAAVRAALTRQPIRMPLTGPPRKLRSFTQPEAEPGFEAVRAEGSLWRNEIRAKPSNPLLGYARYVLPGAFAARSRSGSGPATGWCRPGRYN